MKRDWSIFRITVLLYAVAVLLPLNYYFAKQSFDNMQKDAVTMKRLVYINGAIQRIALLQDDSEKTTLYKNIESSFKAIDHDFLQATSNAKYIRLFRAEEGYASMIDAWMEYKMGFDSPESIKLATKCWNEVNAFSKMTEEMLTYKSETMLDRLYLSLIFTMLSVIILVFVIRLYIRVQIQKHAIHDHVTGLYNKKYYNEVLQTAKLHAVRHKHPLSLLVLAFDNYEQFNKHSKKEREAFLQEFGKVFREFFRQSDTVCRIEENCFVVIAPEADAQNSEKLVLRLEKYLSTHQLNSSIKMECRLGFASYSKESTIQLLDEALEVMKHNPTVSIGGAV